MGNMLKVGIIGLGFVGRQHLDALLRLGNVKVTAVCGHNKEKANELAATYHILGCYADWKDLIDDPSVQVVHDCAPTAMHEEINLYCIRKGKHIFSEKPLGLDLAQVARQYDMAVSSKVAHAVNHQYRANAAVKEIKQRLLGGACGKILFIHGHYFQDSLCFPTDYSARLIPEDGRMRVLSDLGSHLADMIMYLCGCNFGQVVSDMCTCYPERQDTVNGQTIPIESDDLTIALFRMANGIPGSFSVSKVNHGHKNDLGISIECSDCELSWSQQNPDRYQYNVRQAGNSEIFMDKRNCSRETMPFVSLPPGHVMGWSDALRNNMQQFYQSIEDVSYLNGTVDYATFATELEVETFLQSCVDASRQHRWIDCKKEREHVCPCMG